LTFGSYILGVADPGSDIDTMAVCPQFIQREADFFGKFPSFALQDPRISYVNLIPNAFVPLITMKIDQIDIDLQFVNVALDRLPDQLELTDAVVDAAPRPPDQMGLNGFRVTRKILELVPDTDVFRTVLIYIRLFAKVKGIFSNKHGFLGGISYALLVAWVSIRSPQIRSPYRLLHLFFQVFSSFPWYKIPLHLDLENGPFILRGKVTATPLPLFDAMTVYTPVSRPFNSTRNVNLSTLFLITQALKTGFHVMQTEFASPDAFFSSLFEPYVFFQDFNHFILIKTAGPTLETAEAFFSFVEAKANQLCRDLVESTNVNAAIPYTKTFQRVEEDVIYPFVNYLFIGLNLATEEDTVVVSWPILQFTNTVKVFSPVDPTGRLFINTYVRKDLPDFLGTFIETESQVKPRFPKKQGVKVVGEIKKKGKRRK